MEEGSLRVDANVSVRPAGSEELGTKTELKNMNSFRFLERGIEAELARQRELVEAGGTVEQETLHFDPTDGTLTSLRSKEEAHDYRYFPEPDLVPLAPTEEMLQRGARVAAGAARGADRALRGGARARRPTRRACWPPTRRRPPTSSRSPARPRRRAEGRRQLGDRRAGRGPAPGRGERRAPPTPRSSPRRSPRWSAWSQEKKISHGSGKTVLAALVAEGGDPAAIVEREGLAQISDSGELESIVAAAIEANPEAAEQIRAGNGKAIGAIVGAVMKETKGRADGGEVNRLIREQAGRDELSYRHGVHKSPHERSADRTL